MEPPALCRSPSFVMSEDKDRELRSWRDVLSDADASVLSYYARERPPFAGKAPALLVVDVTESFVGSDAPVAEAQRVSRQACGERAWAALPGIARLVSLFRSKGLPVIFTVPDPNQTWVGAATRGMAPPETGSGAVVDSIRPSGDEVVIVKAKASAFFGTPLISGLIKDGRDTIVLVGGTTSGCIRATAVDATSYGLEVLVPEEAVFDRIEPAHSSSLIDIDLKYGRVHATNQVVALLDLGE